MSPLLHYMTIRLLSRREKLAFTRNSSGGPAARSESVAPPHCPPDSVPRTPAGGFAHCTHITAQRYSNRQGKNTQASLSELLLQS